MRHRDWTMAELKVLEEKYPATNTQTLARQMGRDAVSVYSKAAAIGVRKDKKDWGNHGNFRLERVIRLIHMMLHKPKGISEIMRTLDISNRTTYRYISLLAASGFEVERQGTKYIIKNTKCPLCGKTTNNTTNENADTK